MRIYNTLTKQLQEVKPLNPPEVTIYTCGPTVYDYAHIGHWFNYIRMDILVRALRSAEFRTKWVMNITDVGHLVSDADEGEDKLVKGAKREGKSAWEIASFYTDDFLECMDLLNIIEPNYIVKATEHIPEQIELIKKLENKGYTYKIDDGIYYDTAKFPAYKDFAQLDLAEQQASGRVAQNNQKRQASDFALWKFSPQDQTRDMEWDSPWGKGFPGWHIECSAMSMMYLGETMDFHTGGIDHIPVHHTNEIAQSQAVTGKPLANYWVHSNHVTVDGEKISKSLNNGIRLQEIINKGYSTEVVRLHVLESHYRSHSKFSWESLEAARNRYNDLAAMAALRWQAGETVGDMATFSLEDVPMRIAECLQDDLNTPQALAYLSEVSTQLLAVHIQRNMADHFELMLQGIDNLLGLKLSSIKDISSTHKQLIEQRNQARQDQDWTLSDRIREQLQKDGIGVRDTPTGTIWYPL